MRRLGQELFLARDDLRERVRVQCSVLVLVRKTGSDGLAEQRDRMVEAVIRCRSRWRVRRDEAVISSAVLVKSNDLSRIVDTLVKSSKARWRIDGRVLALAVRKPVH